MKTKALKELSLEESTCVNGGMIKPPSIWSIAADAIRGIITLWA